jgi:hypothetical protein
VSDRQPIFGFYVADFPLWKLGCLLNEDWLHEDVVNALAELLYFTEAAKSTSGTPSTLILPTNFLNDAKYLFGQSPSFFSPNLSALRHRLEETAVERVFSFNCHSSHYSVYSACDDSTTLKYADSMHPSPDWSLLSIFQWVLRGTRFPVPSSVRSSDLPLQGSGSGSCAIAALNFVESNIRTDVGAWSPSTSPFFRNRALCDLILYHVTASERCETQVRCTTLSTCTQLILFNSDL